MADQGLVRPLCSKCLLLVALTALRHDYLGTEVCWTEDVTCNQRFQEFTAEPHSVALQLYLLCKGRAKLTADESVVDIFT